MRGKMYDVIEKNDKKKEKCMMSLSCDQWQGDVVGTHWL